MRRAVDGDVRGEVEMRGELTGLCNGVSGGVALGVNDCDPSLPAYVALRGIVGDPIGEAGGVLPPPPPTPALT